MGALLPTALLFSTSADAAQSEEFEDWHVDQTYSLRPEDRPCRDTRCCGPESGDRRKAQTAPAVGGPVQKQEKANATGEEELKTQKADFGNISLTAETAESAESVSDFELRA